MKAEVELLKADIRDEMIKIGKVYNGIRAERLPQTWELFEDEIDIFLNKLEFISDNK